ncbi:MAG: helix-turn-helix transcriptional regulator [Bacteroidetes bacterium]|nr:helix-turn-helix transcriptional regulator [Bacteroidota bacterium]
MEKAKQLKKLISKKPSGWKEKATTRIASPWLTAYSSQIALRVLAIIKERPGLNQSRLAELLGTSRQQVYKILRGQENLTLETIYKLSKALGVELISFPDYEYSKPLKRPASDKLNPVRKLPASSNRKK